MRRWFRGVLRRRTVKAAIVTLKSGSSFRGVLWEHDWQALVLRNVQLLSPDAPTPVDGELVVFVADVDTMQFV